MTRIVNGSLVTLVTVLLLGALLGARPRAVQATDAQIEADLQREITGLKLGPSQVSVHVHDHVVTLDGTVPTLRLKREVVERARHAKGIERVESTIAIARAESDTQLAAEVRKRLKTYPHYTVFDYIDGTVHDAVVTVTGSVTTELKQSQITERIEDVPGVAEIKNELSVLPVSQSDDRIRRAIANRIYRDPVFGNYSRVNPPVHVIVDHGHVSLIGIVLSEVERAKAYTVARSMSGVFTVDNQIRLSSEVREQ
jgi:osmotically-inducible protein OsmY